MGNEQIGRILRLVKFFNDFEDARLGELAEAFSFGSFRLGPVAWDLPFWTFRLESDAWDLRS